MNEASHSLRQPQGWDFLSGGGELGGLIRAFDWSGTPLGAPDTWPQSLKVALRIMLNSSQPIWIGWGKQLIYFYNDPYKSIIGGKHEWALGRPIKDVWSERWRSMERRRRVVCGLGRRRSPNRLSAVTRERPRLAA